MRPESGLCAGLDLSTQSFTAVVIDEQAEIVARSSINYDEELPHYKTSAGMHRIPQADGERVTSPVFMWLEAFDLLLARLSSLLPLSQVVAVSASAQQHGSVFWKHGARDTLRRLHETAQGAPLKDALGACFACGDCPIWADSSTQKECEAIEEAMGGAEALAVLTGSRAYARFTGQQIARIARTQPEIWQACERVSLVSSFLSSLLCGDYAAIDTSDGSGMNLMDLRRRRWSEVACAHAAPDLLSKLGPEPVEPWSILGPVSAYFQQRHGFSRQCSVVCCSGDNPNALVGLGLKPGDVAVSLGTSDTLMGVMSQPSPRLAGHVMCHAGEPSAFFAMLVYKNGDVARRRVRDACCRGDWGEFSRLLRESSPGNEGNLLLGILAEEITPAISAIGFHRQDAAGHITCSVAPEGEGSDDAAKAQRVRGIVEARFLSMASRAAQLGFSLPPRRILVAGGASSNAEMCETMADIFNAPVFVDSQAGPDSAAVGAALRAQAALSPDTAADSSKAGGGRDSCREVARPREGVGDAYRALLARIVAFENELMLSTSGTGHGASA